MEKALTQPLTSKMARRLTAPIALSKGGGVVGPEIVLILGQSNAMGQADISTLSPTLDYTDPALKTFPYDGSGAGSLIAMSDPLPWPEGAGTTKGVSPGSTFARRRLEQGASEVIVVPVAKGSTGFSDVWQWPSGQYAVYAKDALIAVMAAVPNYSKIWLDFVQGEQDANGGMSEATYIERATAFFNGMRAVPGAENAVVVLGSMRPETSAGSANYRAIETAKQKLALSLPNTIFAWGPAGNGIDSLHWNDVGLRTLGNSMEVASRYAVSLNSSAPVPVSAVRNGANLDITVPSTPVPAYVVEYRALGSSDAWSEAVFYTQTPLAAGATFSVAMPGSGDREFRVGTRSRGGTSAWSDVITYDEPSAPPTYDTDLNFFGITETTGAEVPVVDNVGTVGTDWTSATGATSITADTINGNKAANFSNADILSAGTDLIPRVGSYSVVMAFLPSAYSGNGHLFMQQDSGSNYDIFMSKGGVSHNSLSGPVAISPALSSATCTCVAFTFDDATNTMKIYVNGAQVSSGTLPDRTRTAASGKIGPLSGNNGVAAKWMAFKVKRGAAITQDEILATMNEIAADYGITWGASASS